MKKTISVILSIVIMLNVITSGIVSVQATASVIENALQWAIGVGSDDSHGYSQSSRWGPDYDCSSFVISALKSAGLDVGGATYTGNMRSNLTAHDFTWIPWSQISSSANLQRGDILLNEATHTEFYLGNNQNVGAHSNRGYPQTGDQTGTEVSVSGYYYHPWDGVLRYNGGNYVDVGTDFYAYIINTKPWKSLINDGNHNACFSDTVDETKRIWHFIKKSNGSYKIISQYDGNALDVDLGKSESGTDVGVWTDSDTNNQEWFIYGESAQYTFRPNCSDCVLDLTGNNYYDGVNAQIFENNNTDAQKFQIWKLDKDNVPLNLGNDFYSYIINTKEWKNLINDGSHNACFSDTKDEVKKFWHFIRKENGSYKIISQYDDNALDVDLGKSSSGTDVGVWEDADSSNQEWFIYGESAKYYLKPNCSNCVLDLSGGKYFDGVNAQIYERNYTDAQKFQLWTVDRKDVPVNLGNDFYAYIINSYEWKPLVNDGNHHALFSDNQIDKKKIWRFTRKENGTYKIKSVYDDNVLDVDLGKSESGTDVGVWTDSDTKNQEWWIYGETNKFYFKPRCSDCVLDMTGGEYFDGVNAEIYTRLFSNAQLFQIEEIDSIAQIYDIGDVNIDNVINILDVTAIQKCIASLIDLDGEIVKLADTNGNGKVEIKDATLIQQYCAGLIDKF